MHKNTSKKGFTLVEIMIVVVIIGLLAAMAIPAFQRVRQNSRVSAMDNDARQLASAAQQYMLENSVTTVTNSSLVILTTGQFKRICSGNTPTYKIARCYRCNKKALNKTTCLYRIC